MSKRIAPQSGTAFRLKKGQRLRVIDPEGQQVGDLVAFNAHDLDEYISSGRSIDYASKMFLSTGDLLYSNRSNPMLRDFGQGSEAAQYSGRMVGEEWQCPFSARKPVEAPLKPVLAFDADALA